MRECLQYLCGVALDGLRVALDRLGPVRLLERHLGIVVGLLGLHRVDVRLDFVVGQLLLRLGQLFQCVARPVLHERLLEVLHRLVQLAALLVRPRHARVHLGREVEPAAFGAADVHGLVAALQRLVEVLGVS